MNKVPLSTYRIQFNSGFKLTQGLSIIPYLEKLGITHIYCSPLFRARQGSEHGYDVVEPLEINPSVGTITDLNKLSKELRKRKMGLILDIVPNHMAYCGENPYLVDIFENGPASRFYYMFDIEWTHPYEDLKGRVLAPFLGKPYAEVLSNGELRLAIDSRGFYVQYHNLRFPLRIESYERILTHRLSNLKTALGEDSSEFIKYLGLLYAIRNLPSSREEIPSRQAQVEFIKRLLWELYTDSPEVKEFIDGNLKQFNGQAGNPESFIYLEKVLSEQHFRLSFWKVATEEINYRRFFNVNELICVRQEDEGVFLQYHEMVRALCQNGIVDGLRVDHVDGLYEPNEYLKKLREHTSAGYIVVEKILQPKEPLPGFWQVEGTTGYDSLYWINQVFVMRKNRRAFDRLYHSFTGQKQRYQELFYETKRYILEHEMMGDMDNLAMLLKALSGKMRYSRDFTIYGLKEALMEFLSFLPVYRTYIDHVHYRSYDKLIIKRTIEMAKRRRPGLAHELDFIYNVLSLSDVVASSNREEVFHFIKRLQQFTGPLMAKGFEDTLLYVYNRLLSLNEVGGAPEVFGVSLREFHDFMKKRASSWPLSMNTTSTHDTKRGEDVRARLNVLSEMPQIWGKSILKWRRSNERFKTNLGTLKAPDLNDEYLIYQTLIGSFPFNDDFDESYIMRIKQYSLKAIREAKVHTSWVNTNSAYEEAVMKFIDGIFSNRTFLRDFLRLKNTVAFYGMLNSLSQVVLKCTLPGIADIYQGSELWDLNLVDPDNRRPVDFALRERLLHEVSQVNSEKELKKLLNQYHDGRIKLYVLQRCLITRRDHPELFLKGRYIPLKVQGRQADQVIGFAREHEGQWAVVLVGRFFSHLSRRGTVPAGKRFWKDTTVVLPERCPKGLKNILTGQKLHLRQKRLLLSETFKTLPQAVLLGQ